MLNPPFRTWLIIAAVGYFLWHAFLRTPTNAKVATANGAYAITELEPYNETVRVFSTEEYSLGRESDLSPMDIAVGWGVMADPRIYKQFRISQSSRWYFWQTGEMPLPQREVETHSANIHLVPATPELAGKLRRIERDDLVRLSGALIEVKAPDGWHWRSSLSRDDTGEGACEVLLLKRITWVSAAGSGG
ncbi:MAG: hypothetical protein ACT4NU_05105 [Chromatiales bacterium]